MLYQAGRGQALIAAIIYLFKVINSTSGVISETYRTTSSHLSGKLLSKDIDDELRLVETKNGHHRMYPTVPTYDLLNLPPGLEVPHESLIDLISKRQEYNNTSDPSTNEFLKNLKLLRKLADKDELKQLASQQHPLPSGKRHNASLDEEINTINVLIGMLMLANRRLVEQRDKLLAGKTIQDNKRQFDFLEDKKPQHLATYQRPVTDYSLKLAPMNKSLDLFNGSFWSLASAHPAGRRVSISKLDHVLVRPGFNSARLSNGIRHLEEQQSASKLAATGILPDRDGDRPAMFSHKPIVAQDLLHVNRNTYTDDVPGSNYPDPQRARHLFYEQLDRRLMNPRLHHLAPHQLQGNSLVPPYNGYPLAHPLFGSPAPIVGRQSFATPDSALYSSHYPSNSAALLHLKELADSQKNAVEERERRLREQALEVERRQVALRQEHERMRHQTSSITTTERPNQPSIESNSEDPPVSDSPNTSQNEGNHGGMDEESLNELKQSLPGGFVSDDFTDLFPPGILSEAEIKEMRRQQQQDQNHDSDPEEAKEEQEEPQEEQPESEGANGLDQKSGEEAGASSSYDALDQSQHKNSSARSVEPPVKNVTSNNNSTLSTSSPVKTPDPVNVNRGATRFMPKLVAGDAQQPTRSNKTRRSQDFLLTPEQVGAVAQLAARHLPGPVYLTEAPLMTDHQVAPRSRRTSNLLWSSSEASTQPTLASAVDQSFDEELI